MLRLFDAVFDEKYTFNEKLTYLELSNNAGSFVGEGPRSLENVTKKIKSLISAPKTRTEGLTLLWSFFPQCSTEVFIENANCWIQLTAKIIQDSKNAGERSLSCSILVKLIPYIVSFPEISKYTATSIIPTLVQNLLKLSTDHDWIDVAVELLESCLTHFSGSCGNYKIEIERFILASAHLWYGKSLQHVTGCVALLPTCGGGGLQGINHSTAWSEQITNIIASLDQLVEMLYNGVPLSDTLSLMLSSLEIPAYHSRDPLLVIFHSSKIYEFLNLCLAQMLSKQTSFSVKIPVEAIITHICKAFTSNSNTMIVKPSVDAGAIASVIPEMHISCLKVLESIICCCRQLLIPQSNIINDLLLQTLNWTVADEPILGCDRPYSVLRRATYKTLQIWLKVTGSSSAIHVQAAHFFHQFALDFKPDVEVHNLRVVSVDHRTQQKKKSKLKAFGLEQMMSDTNVRKTDNAANCETVKASLQTLKTMLYACGPRIKEDTWKRINGTVITLLLQIQHQPFKTPIPYSNSACRSALYDVLIATLLSSSPLYPPPIGPAIHILAKGQNDDDIEVAFKCVESLSICNSLVHPKVSTIQYVSTTSNANSYGSFVEDEANISEVDSPSSSDRDMEEDEEDFGIPGTSKRGPYSRHNQSVGPQAAGVRLEEDRKLPPSASSSNNNKDEKSSHHSEEVLLTSEDDDEDNSEDDRRRPPPPRPKSPVAGIHKAGPKSSKIAAQLHHQPPPIQNQQVPAIPPPPPSTPHPSQIKTDIPKPCMTVTALPPTPPVHANSKDENHQSQPTVQVIDSTQTATRQPMHENLRKVPIQNVMHRREAGEYNKRVLDDEDDSEEEGMDEEEDEADYEDYDEEEDYAMYEKGMARECDDGLYDDQQEEIGEISRVGKRLREEDYDDEEEEDDEPEDIEDDDPPEIIEDEEEQNIGFKRSVPTTMDEFKKKQEILETEAAVADIEPIEELQSDPQMVVEADDLIYQEVEVGGDRSRVEGDHLMSGEEESQNPIIDSVTSINMNEYHQWQPVEENGLPDAINTEAVIQEEKEDIEVKSLKSQIDHQVTMDIISFPQAEICQVVNANNNVNLNDAAQSPETEAVNLDTGITLQNTLDQVEKINDSLSPPLHFNQKDIHEENNSMEHSAISEGYNYQTAVKKQHFEKKCLQKPKPEGKISEKIPVKTGYQLEFEYHTSISNVAQLPKKVEEEEITLPPIEEMTSSFVDCGQND